MNIHQLQQQALFRVVNQNCRGKILFKLAQGLGQTGKTFLIGPQNRNHASFLCVTLPTGMFSVWRISGKPVVPTELKCSPSIWHGMN